MIEPVTKTAEVFAVDLAGEASDQRSLDLTKPVAAASLGAFVTDRVKRPDLPPSADAAA